MTNDVTCGQCGLPLTEGALKAEEFSPCPACGSTKRNFVVRLEAGVFTLTGMSAEMVVSRDIPAVALAADLLLQTIIVPANKTAEGRLVEAVGIPWFEIVEKLKTDPAVAFQISSDKWEEIIAGAYQRAGFDEVTLTPRSGDYGRDVIAIKRGLGSIRVIDQVKAYKPGNLVAANDVRALIGVLHGDGASKGFLTTTSDFAPRLRNDPLITPFIPSRLELINGKALIVRLQELARRSKDGP